MSDAVWKVGPGPKMTDGWYVGDEPFPEHPLERLVYYARLAPSSHNLQPWKFVVGDGEIDVFADLDRWLRVADKDRRELFLSLGCAIESLRIAADFAGYATRVRHFPVADNEVLVARVTVDKEGLKREDAAGYLLRYMHPRRTSHRVFDRSRPVSDADRKSLYGCFQIDGVSLHYVSERPVLDSLAQLEMRADASLFADADYRDEVAQWLADSFGGKSWLLAKLGQFAMSHLPVGGQVAQADAERLASAPLLGVLTTSGDRRADQIRAGEAYMRIALVAERYELRMQPVSQILEVPETRAELARLCGLGERAVQHVFRIGHADPETGRSPRRPLASLIIRADRAA